MAFRSIIILLNALFDYIIKLLSKVVRRASFLYLVSCPLALSSIVKTAPHFGHLTWWSVLTIPAQPKENAARTNNAKTRLIHFFTPLCLLSISILFGNYTPWIDKIKKNSFSGLKLF
jgi:hypothetical protein